MKYCSKCGAELKDDANFCTFCGSSCENNGESNSKTADSAPSSTVTDIEQNKILALFSYLGILFLIPLLAAPNSKYARFHVNQGIILFICEIAYNIVCSILSAVFLAVIPFLYFIVVILWIAEVAFVILVIYGIINAVTGKTEKLPVIGNYTILK